MSGSDPELSVIIPAFNEDGAIAEVVSAWAEELDALGLDYELRVYDDGSTDKTGLVLRDLASRLPRLVVISQTNRGHGPTVLRGYREARGEWVFQADGDGEIPIAPFRDLWARRTGHDFLLGYRTHRRLTPARWIVTHGSRLAVRALFGTTVRDVNSPFRLVRRAWLQAVLPRIPPQAFAPNVILAGLAARGHLRIYEQPVPCERRRAGRSSLVPSRLWRGAGRALIETVAVAAGLGRNRPA